MKQLLSYVAAVTGAGVVLVAGLAGKTPAQAQGANCILFPPVWVASVLAGTCGQAKATKPARKAKAKAKRRSKKA